MPTTVINILGFALVPAVALVVGAVIAAYRPPSPSLRSLLQHLAAGVVFAAVAGELLPQVLDQQRPLPVVIGFAAGVALLLAIRWGTARTVPAGDAAESRTLLITLGIDLVVDGLLVGIGFAAGAETGLLITAALTMEVLFLGLVAGAALGQGGGGRRSVIVMAGGLAVLLLLGAVLGSVFLASLAGGPFLAVLGFGSAALLYLVVEELLVEAHEVPETPLATAMFFVGFLLLLVIEMSL